MSAIPLADQDINVIHLLDFKSYDYPLEAAVEGKKPIPSEYAELVKRGTVMSTVAAVQDKRAGFAVWERGAKNKAAYIHRLGVSNTYRGRGIGLKILSWVEDDLKKARKKKVSMVLSACTCLGPNDPMDVSGFMVKAGFKWVREIDKAFFQYGKHQQGIVFEKEL